jgi:hypothetical protein
MTGGTERPRDSARQTDATRSSGTQNRTAALVPAHAKLAFRADDPWSSLVPRS